jgi:hypothetical protein
MTRLSPALPKGDRNGLLAIATALTKQPAERHVVIALVDCKATTIDNDTGAVTPLARIQRVEVVAADDHTEAEKIMRRGLEARTGEQTLPLDVADELDAEWTKVARSVQLDPPDSTDDGDVDDGEQPALASVPS